MSDTPIQNEFLKSLKRQIDELIVQLSLGKAEASACVEEKKAELRALIDRIRPQAPEALREKLDALAVQLALGRMESRDSLQTQREKIHRGIDEAKSEWRHAETGLKEKLEEAAESLKTRVDALAFELGVRKEVAREELDLEKEKARAQLQDLQKRLREAADHAEQNAEALVKESRLAFEDIKDNLRRLFGQT